MLPVYTPTEFAHVVLQEKRPILVGCLEQDQTFREQQALLRDVARTFSDNYLVCLWDWEYHPEFCKAYAVAGTPSYLLFYQGEEKTRFLGHADVLNLTNILLVDDYSELDALAPSHGSLKEAAHPVPSISSLLKGRRG